MTIESLQAAHYLRARGFQFSDTQPDRGTDFVRWCGVFRVRVRFSRSGSAGLWVGFTARGPLLEKKSTRKHLGQLDLAWDAVMLAQVFASTEPA